MTPRRVDGNQGAIVAALRGAGASVCLLHTLGGGVPDLLVGYQGKTFLLEVKSSQEGKLTPAEQEFFDTWRGCASVVCSPAEALAAIGGGDG